MTYPESVLSQAQVTQSGPVSVAIAGRTIINCTLQGVQFISTTNPSWYHQEEGQPPKLLFYRSRERAPGIPDRLSADTSGNNAQLTISNVEGGDEGDYYCAVWHNNKLHTVAFRCRTETQSPAQRNQVGRNKATIFFCFDPFEFHIQAVLNLQPFGLLASRSCNSPESLWRFSGIRATGAGPLQREREGERERETETERDRERHRKRDRDREKHRERETERKREGERERERKRHRERERQTRLD
uniref:Ig-like domain-containing protein n=1 Tax=Naja naja TaxID=35670 RepID=A0A8C6VJ60_NAJNA